MVDTIKNHAQDSMANQVEKFQKTIESLKKAQLKSKSWATIIGKNPESFAEKERPNNSLEPLDSFTEQLLNCSRGGNQPMLEDLCKRHSPETLRGALSSLPQSVNRESCINNLEATIAKILKEKQAEADLKKIQEPKTNYVGDIISSILTPKEPIKEEDKLLTWVERITLQAVREVLELTKRVISR